MTKQAFLAALERRLAGLSPEDRRRSLDYYSEMVDDRMEEGMDEEAAVAALGSMEDIAANIPAESIPEPSVRTARTRPAPWIIVLLIVGAPLWLPLLVAFASVVLSVYLTLWAVVLSLLTLPICLLACGLAALLAALVFASMGEVPAILFYLGAALLLIGLGLLSLPLLFPLPKWLCKGTASLCRKAFRKEAKA